MQERKRTRLGWIEASLLYGGVFDRCAYRRRFEISEPQVSVDLRDFVFAINRAGGAMGVERGVLAGHLADISPFDRPGVCEWMETMGGSAYVRVEDSFRVEPDPRLIQEIMASISARRPMTFTYISLSSGVSRKTASIHTVVSALGRMHARGYDHGKGRWSDFVLGRMTEIHRSTDVRSYFGMAHDSDWNDFVDLGISPSDHLDSCQRSAVALEFGIHQGGERVMRVRRALEIYVRIEIGLFPADHKPSLSARS